MVIAAVSLPLFILAMIRDFAMRANPSLGVGHVGRMAVCLWSVIDARAAHRAQYLVGAYKAARNRTTNMDTLIAMGSTLPIFILRAFQDPLQHRST
jgi:cation transport ATPase